MNDLAEKLRELNKTLARCAWSSSATLVSNAADTIDRLTRERDAAVALLAAVDDWGLAEPHDPNRDAEISALAERIHEAAKGGVA